MFELQFFEGSAFLGLGLRTFEATDHFFCEDCGNIWARAVCPTSSQHLAHPKICPECWPLRERIFFDIRSPMLSRISLFPAEELRVPKEVLVRDLFFLAAHYVPTLDLWATFGYHPPILAEENRNVDAKALNDLRHRVLEDKTVTEAELAEAVRDLFGERARALEAAPKKSKS